MIHEMETSDRLKASLGSKPNARPPFGVRRQSSFDEGAEAARDLELRARSCHICGDPPDYCLTCEGCRLPFCDKHRRNVDGVILCDSCAENRADTA